MKLRAARPRRPLIVMPTDVSTLAYLAGVFDGEGYVTIKRAKSPTCVGEWGYSTAVAIGNTSEELMVWLAKTLGGRLKTQRIGATRKPYYVWGLSGESVSVFLQALLPYLIVKKARAELAIAFRDQCHRGTRWVPLTQELVTRREDMRQKMRVLNRHRAA